MAAWAQTATIDTTVHKHNLPVFLTVVAKATVLPLAPGKDSAVGRQGDRVCLTARDGQGVLADEGLDQPGLGRVREVAVAQGPSVAPPTRHDDPVVAEEEAELATTLNPVCMWL